MALGALEELYARNSKGDEDPNPYVVRTSCLILLEELMTVKPEIGDNVKEGARTLAAQVHRKLLAKKKPVEVKVFLLLVGAYGLAADFSMEDLIDFLVIASKYEHAFHLCLLLDVGDRISGEGLKFNSKLLDWIDLHYFDLYDLVMFMHYFLSLSLSLCVCRVSKFILFL